jgi:hypothetical protein
MSIKRMLPEFKMLASSGKILGVSPLFKFGKNPDIDTGSVPEDIISLGGEKLFPTAASTISIVSDDAQDGVAGTGLQTVKLYGLDSDYNEINEEVTMTGLTPVVTTSSFLRVYRMYGTLAGSDQRAAGNIIATHDEGNISEILLGNGQSQDATYTVPAGHILLVDRLIASLERSSSGAAAELHFEIKSFGSNTWREQADVSLAASGSSFVQRDTDLWFPVPEKTDIRVHCSFVATNNTRLTASFDGFLIDLDTFAW